MEYKIVILNKVNLKQNFGKTLNKLQDVAEKVLTKKEFHTYLVKSNLDADMCEGMDGILLNGQYFDWRTFEFKQREIVSAWLNYFDEKQLMKIANAL